MGIRRRARIVDADGVLGRLRGVEAEDPQHPVAIVLLTSGARVKVPFVLLEHHDDGGYTLPARWSDFALVTEDAASIPVIAEEVRVSVRPAPETTVRARRRVVSESRVVEVPVWRERFEIEHVPVNELVATAPAPYQDGDTLVVPCVEEVAVVEVRLRVREELRIRIVRDRHVHRETVTVRRHEVDIDTSPAPPQTNLEDHEGD